MKRPAVFFDRDNTIIVNDGYLGDPTKVVLVDGAAEAIARARSLGYAVVIFSNQSGVARGMFSEQDVHRVNARLDEVLADALPQAVIDRHEFCPFHPEGTVAEYAVESDLRKPKPGMILQAAEKLALDLTRSWVVGDAPRDIEAGKAAGCRTIWYKDTRLPQSMAARELMLTVPDAVVSTLKEATDVIAREALVRHSSAPEVVPESASTPPPPPASPPTPPAAQRYQDELAYEPDPERLASASPAHKAATSAKPLMQVLAEKRAAAAAAVRESEAAAAHAAATNPPPSINTARLEELAEQILQAVENRRTEHEGDFSISKLLAGIMQIVAIATLLLAYMPVFHNPEQVLLIAVFLQVFTVALLIMGRQK